MAKIVIPNEDADKETRVAATPASVRQLIKAGHRVSVVKGAGARSFIDDDAYAEVGAEIASDAAAVADADVILKIGVPQSGELEGVKSGASLISFLWPLDRLELVRQLADQGISAFAMDAIPRITRAQKYDALSSQANLAGYKAVMLAADHLPKIFPLLMTAAGTIRPAKVVVIGAGVAGLQAIATAKRLGAVVEVSDVRPEVKQQAESLGATYIEVDDAEYVEGSGGYAKEQSEAFKARQQEVLRERLIAADVIITTALIPYRDAPVLIKKDVVEAMQPGSVIVDLAAERGGNCELTKAGKVSVKHGVTIVGSLNLPAMLPSHASQMYAKNVANVVSDVSRDGNVVWNLEDEVVAGALITHEGKVRHQATLDALNAGGGNE